MYQINYFLSLIKYYWEELKAYPIRFLTNIFWLFFGFVPQFFLWYIISKNSNSLPYSLTEIILYFLFVWGLLYSINFVNSHFKTVQTGQVITNVIKPISLTNIYFFNFYASILVNKISNIIFIFIIGAIFSGIINSLLGILFFLFGLIIGCLFFTILFFAMFWLKSNWGIKFTIDIVVMFASGLWIPLDLFPLFWQNILDFLPFKFMFYVPTKIYIGQIIPSWFIILQYCFWIIILYCIARIMEYYSLKYYEQLGG